MSPIENSSAGNNGKELIMNTRHRKNAQWLGSIFQLACMINTIAIGAEPVSLPLKTVPSLCSELKTSFKKLKWDLNPCEGIDWKVGGNSIAGRPLVYAEFGKLDSPNTTLIFSAVHGDEITPLYLGIELAHWLKAHPESIAGNRVVIAPLVNPDGFLKAPRSRGNLRGVDVNRNFPTRDWSTHALHAWRVKYKSDPRRFPGSQPRSEPETVFQEELIKKIRPQKILSIHSPLNFMDYDGPSSLSLARFPKEYVQRCLSLRTRLKATSSGFFPGSLGNYAGQEMGIPTLTLELPSADPKKADAYWKLFSRGIQTMIQYVVPSYAKRHVPTTGS